MKSKVLFACVITAAVWTLPMTPAGQTLPPSLPHLNDAEIQRILIDRIDGQRQSLGMVVGIVTPGGRRIITYGKVGHNDTRPVTGETVFEIGSVTKVFTSWLLGDMVRRGEVALADPVTDRMQSSLATGHDAQLKTAARWNVPAMAGGGSLHSSADDLLTFMAALADPRSPFAAALPIMLGTRRQAPGFQQALGWMVLSSAPDDEILFHDGQTLGFASSMAYDPRARTGAVVLSNTAAGVGDIARHVLRPAIPLAKPTSPAPLKTEMQVDPTVFDRYAGRYEPGPGAVFTTAREGDALVLQLPGLPRLRLRPESEREFFVAENTRIGVTFEVDPSGQVTRMLVKAPTGNVPAARLERP